MKATKKPLVKEDCFYKNIKNDTTYKTIKLVKNATNSQDGQVMVLYKNNEGDLFVRDIQEFAVKFEEIKVDN